MKIKVGALRAVIKEELQRLSEAPKPTVVMTTIKPEEQSAWDEAARSLRLKSFLKFVPGEGGVNVVYQGYGTPGAAKKQADSMLKKIQKAVGKVGASRAAEGTLDDAKALKLLTFAFTSTVTPEDVKYIRFQVLKNAVRMVDYDGMLGNMDAGVGSSDLQNFGVSARQLGDWLASHGARPMKPQRRPRPTPSMYD